MIMVSSIHSLWPTWITCQSLQSIYSQWEFSANSYKAQELPQCLMIILFFGIMVDFARLTRLTLLAFQNCFLTLVTLNYSLSQHFCSHSMTTRFTELLYQTKNKALAQSDKGNAITSNTDAVIAYLQGNGDVTIDVPLTLTNLVVFLQGMKLRYNDGSGTRDIVTFLSSDFAKDMRLKCKIKLSNYSVILVDPETLNFIENPDIALIPQTSSDYVQDSANITPSQMEHIMYPKALSPLQEEIMSHHTWLHHLPWPKLITMAEAGEIPHHLASLKGRCPIGVACLFGTAHKHHWRLKSKESHLVWKESGNHPGARASLDHLVSAQPGLIPQISGRLTCMQINGATIFVDHNSDHVYIFLMQDLTLDWIILAKHAYEQFLSNLGVTSQAYHADNGHFSDNRFCDECTSCHQVITFCGIGGYHQNGIAERKIKELTHGVWTLLLHAKQMLPEYISTILWPFALKCCKDWLNNLTHHADGQTPYQTIAGLESSKIILSNFHTFGCTCYVLDHCFQSGNGIISKWKPHARMGIYVGWSPSHAFHVALVLNPRTGHVSSQFHVVFDDDFTTVPYLCTATVPAHQADLVRSSATIEMYTEKQIGTWQSIPDIEIKQGDFSGENQSLSTSTQDCEGVEDTTALSNCSNQWVSFVNKPGIEQEINHPIATPNDNSQIWQMPTPINLDSSGLHHSSRIEVMKRHDKVYSNTMTLTNQTAHLPSASPPRSFKSALVLFFTICSFGYGLSCIAHSLQEKITVISTFPKAIDSYHWVNTLYNRTINCFSTLAQSSIASNETFNYNQALKQADFCKFIQAMIDEVNDHEIRGHLTRIKHCDLPQGTKTIMSIWSFKRKGYPDGTLNKHKAHLCAHGGMQTWGKNYWEIYSIVVNWASVHLILAIAKIHGLLSKSINFMLSFPQADIEIPVYMELPISFEAPDGENCKTYVLKLNKKIMAWNRLGTIGLWNLAIEFKIVVCAKVILTLAFSLGKNALSSPPWTIALS
jgi:hypothetical protein